MTNPEFHKRLMDMKPAEEIAEEVVHVPKERPLGRLGVIAWSVCGGAFLGALATQFAHDYTAGVRNRARRELLEELGKEGVGR